MTIAIGLNILQDVPRAEEMGSIGVNLINRIDEGSLIVGDYHGRGYVAQREKKLFQRPSIVDLFFGREETESQGERSI